MNPDEFFETAFLALTDDDPLPWQRRMFHLLLKGAPPASCVLPTGLGKTAIIVIWLIGLAWELASCNLSRRVATRLVYVVNRRTVVDQATNVAIRLRERIRQADVAEQVASIHILQQIKSVLAALSGGNEQLCPAISTLRGQFADNGQWRANPAVPAIIIGTVDLIGSRLLFSGYGVGFRGKPLHAGFLGQDVLLVHDEAHLESAFQVLLTSIETEQRQCKEFRRFRVMELTATSRDTREVFTLDGEDLANETVRERIEATKAVHLHEVDDDKAVADEVAQFALKFRDSKQAILVFLRKLEDVNKVRNKFVKEKLAVEILTGTIRGKERDGLVEKPIFKRFLPNSTGGEDVVYLVCTSAGEVGVNFSADHLVCDLSTFESMAQRFGRVNRFGISENTEVHVVHPTEFDETDEYDSRRSKTLALLKELNGNGSPKALGNLDSEKRLEAFAPTPTILPVTDILFDAWALTTIRGILPGRPPVEPYLHGLPTSWEPPETHVAWRKEVWELRKIFQTEHEKREFEEYAADLLDDYPLKPHELLRDASARVFDLLRKLKVAADTPVWIQAGDGSVRVTTLGAVIESDKDELNSTTVILPEQAGGLNEQGMFDAASATADDVADEWYVGNERIRQRVRVWSDDDGNVKRPDTMRLIRRVEFKSQDDDDASRSWHWFEIANEGEESSKKPVLWEVHVSDVVENAKRIVGALNLPGEIDTALDIAAQFHDHGKRRKHFQTFLGNFGYPKTPPIAKSGKKTGRIAETYRHEFGSLIDIQTEEAFKCLSHEMKDLVLHLIAVHHGRGRPHFSSNEAFDPDRPQSEADEMANSIPGRFAKLQRKYGRWGLAYLESLLRAADWAASAAPSKFVEDDQ